jgi:hypothetical protein
VIANGVSNPRCPQQAPCASTRRVAALDFQAPRVHALLQPELIKSTGVAHRMAAAAPLLERPRPRHTTHRARSASRAGHVYRAS